MKKLIIVALLLISTSAFANPFGTTTVCRPLPFGGYECTTR